MITYNVLGNLVSCCFEIVMLSDFAKTLLGGQRKYERYKNLIISILVIGIHLMVNIFDNSMINLFAIPIIYYAYVFISYSASVLKCVSVAICFYFMAMAPEFIVSVVFGLSCGHDAEQILNSGLSRLYLTFIAKIIMFIIVKCVEQIHRKNEYEEASNGIFCSLLILPIATMVMLIGVFYAGIHLSIKNKLFLEIGTSMLLFANVFMFYLFDRLIDSIGKVNKIERLYLKSETEKRYYQQMGRIGDKHRGFLHDVKKYISTAVELIQSGNPAEAVQIFERMDIEIRRIFKMSYCSNKILNVILLERQAKAEELGIKFKAKLSADLYTDLIGDIDLISIIGNLLDNAIDAAKQRKDGFVNIAMFMANEGYFMIWEVSNNFAVLPIYDKKGFITSKRNKNEHGIGIHTVEKVVKSYDGKLNIDIIDQKFIATIIFQITKSSQIV